MHKFILGENPMAPESSGTWIIHLPTPQCIIEASIWPEKIHSKKAAFFKNYRFDNANGDIELWELRLYHYFSTSFPDDAETERLAIKMLDDAWHWYKSYLEWEDKQIDIHEED